MTATESPPRPKLIRDHVRDGWHTFRDGVAGYLFAPHHDARCPCGERHHHHSPLCWECHVAIFGVMP